MQRTILLSGFKCNKIQLKVRRGEMTNTTKKTRSIDAVKVSPKNNNVIKQQVKRVNQSEQKK